MKPYSPFEHKIVAGPNPNSEDYLSEQYEDVLKYAARFAVNDLAPIIFDPELEVAEGLIRTGTIPKVILEMGTSDAHFLRFLNMIGFGSTLDLDGRDTPRDIKIGMDPNYHQRKKDNPWIDTGQLFEGGVILGADANHIPIADNSVDLYLAQFMWYHLKNIQQAFSEAKRVMKDDGIFVLTTSGENHKKEPRDDEALAAVMLSGWTGVRISPPERMNDGFTTEKAQIEIPKRFDYAYMLNYEGRGLLNDSYSRQIVYPRSLETMHDRFSPVPPLELYKRVIKRIIENKPEDATVQLSRSVFFASNRKLNLGSRFVPIGR